MSPFPVPYASTIAGYTNTMNLAIQKAVAAYDQTVAGLQSTLSAAELAASNAADWSAVGPASKAFKAQCRRGDNSIPGTQYQY